MEVDDGKEMIIKAYEKRDEEKAYQMYLSIYPNMTDDNFIHFNEFYNPRKQENNHKETAEEILSDVREMMNSNEWR